MEDDEWGDVTVTVSRRRQAPSLSKTKQNEGQMRAAGKATTELEHSHRIAARQIKLPTVDNNLNLRQHQACPHRAFSRLLQSHSLSPISCISQIACRLSLDPSEPHLELQRFNTTRSFISDRKSLLCSGAQRIGHSSPASFWGWQCVVGESLLTPCRFSSRVESRLLLGAMEAMTARIGTPSQELLGIAAPQKRYEFARNATRVKCSAHRWNSAHESRRAQTVPRIHHEAQLAVKKVRVTVGKKVSIGSSNSKPPRRRGSSAPIASASRYEAGSVERITEGDLGDASRSVESDGAESNVHFGRRMLLGSVFTAVVLSNFDKPGLALAVGDDQAKAKGGHSPEKGTSETAERPQFGEKWKLSRVYDAAALGEPAAVSGDRNRVWEKLLQARVVYLGEAERVPDSDDRVLELGILRKLRDACFQQQRPVSLALDAFPAAFQSSLDKYMSHRLSDTELQSMVGFWPAGLWEEYLPILQYCRISGVRLMACGTPPEVLRKIQAKGIQGLSEAEKKMYVPPAGGGFGAVSVPLVDQLALADITPSAGISSGPGPFQYSQARIIADHVMTQVVEKGMVDGGSVGLLIVITGASHVVYGSRGTGLPARVQKKLTKRTQAVVLLNPERQRIRKEGDVPEADFLWYSAARACNRNCFDRAEVARVMDAAGRRRDALPQDIQAGLERGLVDPEVLKSFFELDKHPIIAALTGRFQGLRERWLADPRFLQRLAIEESISITTTLLAQYQRRGDRFWHEIEYVITDSGRGAVVDFFTVWLPAPTLSFRTMDSSQVPGGFFEGFAGWLGTVPDNAFQRARVGERYDLKARVLAVLLGGLKLFGVGFVSSVGTLSVSNGIWNIRKAIKGDMSQQLSTKRSPMFKTAFVYGSFLGLSANLRYQAIAGIVEHWIADYFLASQPLAGSVLSFSARIANSYWGTGQWVDLARLTGLQSSADEGPPSPSPLPEDHEAKLEDSLDAQNSAWEQQQPPLPPENADGAEAKQESEPTRAP